MPPKPTKQKAAPLATRGQSKHRSTQRRAPAVDQHSEAGVTSGQSARGSHVRSQQEAPGGHSDSSQEVLAVLSSDLITQIVARVTQEVTSHLAQANAPDPTQPAALCAQPPSVTPTQQLSSPSSLQPQLSEVPVCSLGDAAVQSSVNSVFSHLTGELNPPVSLPSSLFTSSALPVDTCVSKKLKSKIWTLDRYLLTHCLRISITSPFKIPKVG